MLTKRRVVVLLCVLVLLGGCAWVYELRFAPFVAEAELMVQPRSDLDLLFDGLGSAAANEDQAVIAQNMSHLIRSRTVIAKALSKESIKNHPLIKQHAADPEGFVMSRLEVEVQQPGLIAVRMWDRHDPELCADIVNAIVGAFVSGTQAQERSQKLANLNRLDKHLVAQAELEKKKWSELEALRQTLGPTNRDPWAQIEFAKVQAEQLKVAAGRSYEKLVDLCLLDAEVGSKMSRMRLPRPVPLDVRSEGKLHDEVVHTATTDWVITGSTAPLEEKVERGWDEENRLAVFRRYAEEYQRNMADLARVLGQLAAAQPALPEKSSGSFELDTRQHEIDLLREQIDDLCRFKSRAVLTLESGARVEMISKAVKPVSRRHWFAWRSDAE